MAFLPPQNIFINKPVPNETAALNQKSTLIQQTELEKTVGDNYTLTPVGVHIEDLDLAIKKWCKENFTFLPEEKKYFFAEIQRFSQFMKTWENTDATDTEVLPFIVTNRFTVPEYGTLFKGSFNIPNKATYTLFKEVRQINGKNKTFYYEIPQPTNIDLNYDITMYANHRRDINEFNEAIIQMFKESQFYVDVKGHNMLLKLNQNTDNSKLDVEERKYLSHTYNFTLKGFILNEKDIVVKDSIENVLIDTNVCEVKNTCVVKMLGGQKCEKTLEFLINKKAPRITTYVFDKPYTLQSKNYDTIDLKINDIVVDLPYNVKATDTLSVELLNNVSVAFRVVLIE
jgi:hypothetical protein